MQMNADKEIGMASIPNIFHVELYWELKSKIV